MWREGNSSANQGHASRASVLFVKRCSAGGATEMVLAPPVEALTVKEVFTSGAHHCHGTHERLLADRALLGGVILHPSQLGGVLQHVLQKRLRSCWRDPISLQTEEKCDLQPKQRLEQDKDLRVEEKGRINNCDGGVEKEYHVEAPSNDARANDDSTTEGDPEESDSHPLHNQLKLVVCTLQVVTAVPSASPSNVDAMIM
eukprot:CAMPEP_0194516710 /NCGR_PEP_ID=MMETSP0253-20130528/49670_1 /TAXON_ID=2966 /ORGANISM="Noctiluca scintillans" /LENGTH=199 /DNA_ID=CAMNT_0039360603 /DNA_START=83 /DNA_END=683 /DNA_ORIENTATION=+